jgi:hypothetical protein
VQQAGIEFVNVILSQGKCITLNQLKMLLIIRKKTQLKKIIKKQLYYTFSQLFTNLYSPTTLNTVVMEINIFSQKKCGMKYRKHYIYIPHRLSQLVQEMPLPNRVVTATKSHRK